MSQYDAKQAWNQSTVGHGMAYPSEYVIRIFKGSYPHLKLRETEKFEGQRIADLGCGDGRNLALLKQCGFDIYGTEITKEITDDVRQNLSRCGINDADIRVGVNDSIPFDNGFFDFLLSWNSCYYMGQNTDFGLYVKEFARVVRQRGYLVLSIPKKSCFIFEGAEAIRPGYCVIRKDPFNVRNGEVMKIFQDENEIKETFGPYFDDFIFASIHDNCFGHAYHWHLAVCRRKS